MSLLFGLSGTGKTTLSADSKRNLIGDDEHCWSDQDIFNIEGGCYAKTHRFDAGEQTGDFRGAPFWRVLEYVVLDEDRLVDYTNVSVRENTRSAYPIEFVRNARVPCVAGHPTEIIFLTCDAFGGAFSSQLAFTGPGNVSLHERLHRESCWHRNGRGGTPRQRFRPVLAARSFQTNMQNCLPLNEATWHTDLVNTGWSGRAYGTGKRIKLANMRAIIDAIHSGTLAEAKTQRDAVFGFDAVTKCPNVPAEILSPRNVWADKAAFDATAKMLADLFVTNFVAYEGGVSAEVKAAGPASPELP